MNINSVVISGNLTKDPELRTTPGGTSVCNMRVAVNERRKDSAGQWVDAPNYFSVTVWGNQGANCAQYLAKGSPVNVQGRLSWREWDAKDGSHREAVDIVAYTVQFLYSDKLAKQQRETDVEPDLPADYEGLGGGAAEPDPHDDIPF